MTEIEEQIIAASGIEAAVAGIALKTFGCSSPTRSTSPVSDNHMFELLTCYSFSNELPSNQEQYKKEN